MKTRKIRMPLWGMRISKVWEFYCCSLTLMLVIGLFTSHVTIRGAVTPPVIAKKEHIGKKSVSKMYFLLRAAAAQAKYAIFGSICQ